MWQARTDEETTEGEETEEEVMPVKDFCFTCPKCGVESSSEEFDMDDRPETYARARNQLDHAVRVLAEYGIEKDLMLIFFNIAVKEFYKEEEKK